MTTDPRTERLEKALDAYLSGDSGIPFDVLSRLAEPIFDLYEIDPATCAPTRAATREVLELSLLVAVLDTARLFWSWFLLDEAEGRARFLSLQEHLLGPDADVEEQADFLELVSILRDRWQDLEAAGLTGAYDLASFDDLAAAYASANGDATAAALPRFGPDDLELPEALALFARPMLDQAGAMDDPDVIEDILARAHAYWDLAQAPEQEQPALLEQIKRRFAESPSHANVIEQEARRMVVRFGDLFPEKGAF